MSTPASNSGVGSAADDARSADDVLLEKIRAVVGGEDGDGSDWLTWTDYDQCELLMDDLVLALWTALHIDGSPDA